jgi:signal transduction histidine kinase
MGLFSLWRVTDYHLVGGDIRDHYLPNTQFLGDLNNLISDFRTAESTALLADTDAERATNDAQLEQIDRRIALAQHNFEHFYSDPADLALYEDFAEKWRAYRDLAHDVLAEARTPGSKAAAIQLYLTKSHDAYDAAADALWVLSETNRLAAQNASQRADQAYHLARLLTFGAVGLSAVIVLGGLGFIRRSILSPLLKLTAAMRKLAANDMDIGPLNTHRRDEIGDMARAVLVFRQNAIELAEKFAHEQRMTELQRNFVSMASHEFRTPLTVIDGHAQRLNNMRERIQPEEIKERAGKIRQAVSRMTGVIGNLLDSARLVEVDAQLVLHATEFDLALTLREIAALYREMAPRQHIVEDFENQDLVLVGDQKLLFQVFSNMMSNAAKYSPDGGVVRLAARREGDEVRVTVEDNGVGIPEQDRERLFDRYYRGSNVSGIVGTGIGLYLVKTVVDLHGGSITVASHEGQGTAFLVTLPVRPR